MSHFDDNCPACDKHTREKPMWGPGQWQDEPNRFAWEHAGLPCILHRGYGGAWCGYVGLSPGHPHHGKHYTNVDADVHGGLTYAEHCSGHICHQPKPGEPEDIWWLGFDCNHSTDLAPGASLLLNSFDHYWTFAEAKADTERLADQLAILEGS